ncbi:hypothetical protein DAMA08_011650 [Martiniozyma asiatica (nom. inval.)]|nr:hypothetical protein DAMA08_011650 [Martiniozyma asiatica]
MLDTTETQAYSTPVSVLTIPRANFWIFKSGILSIIYKLIDAYEGHGSDCDSIRSFTSDESNFNTSNMRTSNSLHDLREERTGSGTTDTAYGDRKSFELEEEFEDLTLSNFEQDDGLFFHLAFNTEEVTLMCSSMLIQTYLTPALKIDSESTLIPYDFFIIQVYSDGTNIGKKILELTKPLSMQGISLFFISNYWSDLVLVPLKDKTSVMKILSEELNTQSTESSTNDIESKTFNLFKEMNIIPRLETKIKLVMTGARSGDNGQVLRQMAESLCRLNTEITFGNSFPDYFALTRTPTAEIGILLPYFSTPGANILRLSKTNIMGSLEDCYFPILIDLKSLPIDLKGIVAGVASRLQREEIDEMSYLSLGKSGVVLIPEEFEELAGTLLDATEKET